MKRFVLVLAGVVSGALVFGASAQGCSGASASLPEFDSAIGNDTGSADVTTSDSSKPDTNAGDAPAPDAKGGDGAVNPSDAGTPDGIQCGMTKCAVGQLCCPTINNGIISTTCAATCAGGNSLSCDGPEDCGGKVCCAQTTTGGGTFPNCPPTSASAKCESSCTSNVPLSCASTTTVRLCHVSADCTESSYSMCCTFSLSGNTSTFCTSPLLASFATACAN